jgi:hypothetical protein
MTVRYSMLSAMLLTAERGLRLRWDLRRDNIFDTDATITPLDNGAQATIRLPNEPGNYRLYLYLSTQSDAVDTASVSVQVE